MSAGASRLARGGGLSFATVLVEKVGSLLVVLLLARLLPVAVYGEYAFVIAYLGIFQIVADAGLETVLVQRLASEPGRREFWFRGGLGLRFATASVAALLAVGFVPWAGGTDGLRAPVMAAAGLLLVAQPVARALLRTVGAFRGVFLAALLSASVGVIAPVVVARQGGSLAGVLGWVSFGPVVGLLVAVWLVGRHQRVSPVFEFDAWRSLLAESWPVAANLLVVVAALRVVPLLLMRTAGPSAVGFFTSAARIVEATNLVAEAALLVLYPSLVRRIAAGRAEGAELALLTARLLATVQIAVALVLSISGRDLMGLLFGETFAASGPVLSILALTIPFSALGTLYVSLLVAVGRQRLLLGLNALAAVGQILLQLVLVPRYGSVGAAAGIVAGAVINHAVLAVLPATRPWILPCVRAALGPVALAAALVGAATLLGAGSGIGTAAFLVLAFVVTSILTGAVRPADFRRLAALHGA